MKLVTYIHQGASHLGAIRDSQVIDVARAHAAYQEHTGASTGPAGFPADMLALLQAGGELLPLLASIVQWAGALPPSAAAAFSHPQSQVRLAAPLSNPSKIICVGLNYHDHCLEQDIEIPGRPILFAKFPSSIVGPEDEITWPPDVSQKVDSEVELAVVIGRQLRFRGYAGTPRSGNTPAIVNDASARDVQFADGQWIRGKSFDTFCPMGPCLLTADEVPDPHDLRIRCWVKGELRQDSNTRELIFKVPDLLAYISKTCTVMPGDLLITGTPGGVGVFRDPQVFLQTGDRVEMEIEGLGRLCNRVG